MLYLGIDQHGKQLTVNLRGEDGEVLLRRQVSTEWERVEAFLREVDDQGQAQGGWLAIVEVCGFNDWLLELLSRHGCREVILMHPDKRNKKKTDRRDANSLSELLWVNRQRLLSGQRVNGLRRVYVPSPVERQDRRLTALRRNVARRRTKILNQIKHLLLRHNALRTCPTRGIQTLKARQWLRQLAQGQAELERSPLDELDRLELGQLSDQWDLCELEERQLDQQIQQRHHAHPQSAVVASLPGCAAYTALAIASRIGPIQRFKTPRSLANYFGLTPGCRNSGEATQRLGSITKEGSAMVRFLLGQWVLHVLRKDPRMRSWYQRIKQRRGSKIARVAVMRRLCTILWHMLSKNEAYQLTGPPRPRKKGRALADV